jgi:hypothetical protein
MNKRKVIFNTIHLNAVDYSLADFESDVQKARKAGATHMMISQLEKSRWIWDLDRNDPYPNWGMLNAALFKIIVPPELKGHLPEDYAARNLATLTARADILNKYGLKAAMQFCEPFYLPEIGLPSLSRVARPALRASSASTTRILQPVCRPP